MDDPVSLAVCSMSPSRSEYEEFISKLESHDNVNVTYVCIATDLLKVRRVLCQYDAAILIHSIDRGRLSITDVQDAQYDEFLPHLSEKFGPSRIGVLVHGLSDPEASRESFVNKQPTTMRCSSWVKLCKSLQDEEVTSMMNLFLSKVQESPKPAPGWPTPPAETGGSLQESQRHPQVEHITATKVTYRGERWSLDIPSIDFVMCTQACTRDSLLQTLRTETLQNMINCLCFEQTQDGWQHITSDTSRTDPSRTDPKYDSLACVRSAIFIYRDNIPTEFDDDTLDELKDIVNEKAQTEPVLVAMQGAVDDVCLEEILDISSSCTDGDVHIVCIQPRVQGQSSERDHPKTEMLSLKDKMEGEFKREVALKGQVRSGIRELEEEMSEWGCKIDVSKGIVTKLELERSQLNSDIQDKQTTLQEIEKKVNEATGHYKEREKASQKRLDKKKAETENLAETIAIQKAQLSEIKETYTTECKQLEKVKNNIGQYEEKCDMLRSKYEILTANVKGEEEKQGNLRKYLKTRSLDHIKTQTDLTMDQIAHWENDVTAISPAHDYMASDTPSAAILTTDQIDPCENDVTAFYPAQENIASDTPSASILTMDQTDHLENDTAICPAQEYIASYEPSAAAKDKDFTMVIDEPTPDSNMRDDSDEENRKKWLCCLY